LARKHSTRRSSHKEVKEGRLTCSRRCNRVWFLGQWLLDWIAAGVQKPGEQEEEEQEEVT